MSLLRLLTAGKSLVGLKNSEGRYHLPSQKPLPKFGSKKNPFRASALPEKIAPDPEGGIQVQEEAPILGDLEGEPGRAAGLQENRADNEVFQAVTERAKSGVKEQPKVLERPARRTSPVKALLLWGRAKKLKPFGRWSGTPMVQGELSLDRVKVVRNDLSESDLEVVRAEHPMVVKPLASAGGRTAAAPASESRWGAAAGRLLGIGKM
jgi:hypothetical protein